MKVINEKHNAIINIYQQPSVIEKSYINVEIRPIEQNELVQYDNIVRTIEILIPIKNKFIKQVFNRDFIIDLYNQITEIESENPIKPFNYLQF